MTKLSVSTEYDRQSSERFPASNRQRVNQDAFLRRMEWLNTRRDVGRTNVAKLASQHLDAKLLKEREALDKAWIYEVAASFVAKRLNTAEADEIAKSARAASAEIARRIEAATALTLDGLKVKARAGLWRRHGEPLGSDSLDDRASSEAQVASSTGLDQ